MPPKRPDGPERPEEIHEISRALGEVQAGIQHIIKTQVDDRKFAAQYRTDVRHQIGEIADTVSGLLRDVAAMQPEVDKARDARIEMEAQKARRDRQLKTAGALVGLAVGLATFGRQVIDWIVAMFHKG
jgi:hypothetical protein